MGKVHRSIKALFNVQLSQFWVYELGVSNGPCEHLRACEHFFFILRARAVIIFVLRAASTFKNSNPFSISHVVFVIFCSYKNGTTALLYIPFTTLKV